MKHCLKEQFPSKTCHLIEIDCKNFETIFKAIFSELLKRENVTYFKIYKHRHDFYIILLSLF